MEPDKINALYASLVMCRQLPVAVGYLCVLCRCRWAENRLRTRHIRAHLHATRCAGQRRQRACSPAA